MMGNMEKIFTGPLTTRLVPNDSGKTYSYQIGRFDNWMNWIPVLIATKFYGSLVEANDEADRSLARIQKIGNKLVAKHYRHLVQDGVA